MWLVMCGLTAMRQCVADCDRTHQAPQTARDLGRPFRHDPFGGNIQVKQTIPGRAVGGTPPGLP